MRRAIGRSVRIFHDTFQPGGPVLELGALYMPGYERVSDFRPLFPAPYVGLDIRVGPGVDLIGDAHATPIASGAVACVLAFEVFEHLPDPWAAVREVRRVLQPDGFLAMSVPFQFRLHGMPSDYWRFTTSGVNALLRDFEDRIVFSLGPRLKPAFTFAVASPRHRADWPDLEARFRAEVTTAFRTGRMRAHLSVFKERARDILGLSVGRAELGVTFHDPGREAKYRYDEALDQTGTTRRL